MDISKDVFVLILLHLCIRCYTQENAPLYMYATSDDLKQAFGISSDRIDLVSDGRLAVNSLATPETAQILTISETTAVIPVVILSCTENMSVNFTWTSMNTSILKNPMMSIPLSFIFPKCSYRFFILFSCAGVSTTNVRVVSKLTMNAYTKERSYAPVEFYVLKTCGIDSLEITNVTEYLAGANDSFEGCFNDTDPPAKPSTVAAQIIVVESSSNASPGIIAVAVILPVVVLAVIVVTMPIFLVWYFRRRSRKLARENFTIEMMSALYQVDNPLFDRVEALKPTGPHEKEFPLDSVTCVRELGEGAFGRVYQGVAKNIIVGEESTTVAVKQLKVNTFEDDGIVVREFFKEVTFMSKLDHPRILKLLGVCSVTEPYCMIFEYMDLGSLNSYLRSAIGLGPDCDEVLNKEICFLQLSDLLSIVEQIAEGMEYLSNQNLVHRDLATRNCLVATGPMVKISDFGLSRDVSSTDYYRVHGRAVLPIRWMAPEAIIYGKFTTATDVWSFGVVVWEVFTYGQQPYIGMTNEEVIKFVIKQGTLEPPSGCPQKVASIMTQCWLQSPGSRPSFSKLFTTIQQLPSILLQTHPTTSLYPSL